MIRPCVLVLLVACGKPASEHKAALEHYVNVDMRLHWTELRWIQKPFETGLPSPSTWLVNAMRHGVIPDCARFVAGAKTVKVPGVAAGLHAELIAIVEQHGAIAAEIVAALDANDGVRFEAAHEHYWKAAERRRVWSADLDALLAEHGARFDKSAIPEVVPKPPVPRGPCGEAPCPCEPSSEVRTGGRLVSCTFSEWQPIGAIECAAEKVTFRADGSLATCVHRGDALFERGEVELHPNRNRARGVLRQYYPAHQHGLCGPGPVTQFDDEVIESCTMVGPAKLGGVTLAKTAKADVVFYRDGAVRYIKHEGVERCFDPAGKPSAPCSR